MATTVTSEVEPWPVCHDGLQMLHDEFVKEVEEEERLHDEFEAVHEEKARDEACSDYSEDSVVLFQDRSFAGFAEFTELRVIRKSSDIVSGGMANLACMCCGRIKLCMGGIRGCKLVERREGVVRMDTLPLEPGEGASCWMVACLLGN